MAEFHDPPTWLFELARGLWGPDALRHSPATTVVSVGVDSRRVDGLNALRKQVEDRPPEEG
jgi:hypothetical protein